MSGHVTTSSRKLLDELERDCARPDEWERTRLDILDSTERRERVEQAKARPGLA